MTWGAGKGAGLKSCLRCKCGRKNFQVCKIHLNESVETEVEYRETSENMLYYEEWAQNAYADIFFEASMWLNV